MVKLESPCSYQGGKQRLAKEIVVEILKYADENTVFYDLCCGSGAVFLELINQGIAPERIHAIDIGSIVNNIKKTTFVSEGYIMPNIPSFIEFGGRRKGNINGIKKKDDVKEILNVFQKG